MTSRALRIMGCGDRVGEEKAKQRQYPCCVCTEDTVCHQCEHNKQETTSQLLKADRRTSCPLGDDHNFILPAGGHPDHLSGQAYERGGYQERNIPCWQGSWDEYYFFQHRFTKAIFSYETALHLLGVVCLPLGSFNPR